MICRAGWCVEQVVCRAEWYVCQVGEESGRELSVATARTDEMVC